MKTYLVSFEHKVFCRGSEYVFDYCLVIAQSEDEAFKIVKKKYPTAKRLRNKTIYDFPVKGGVK